MGLWACLWRTVFIAKWHKRIQSAVVSACPRCPEPLWQLKIILCFPLKLRKPDLYPLHCSQHCFPSFHNNSLDSEQLMDLQTQSSKYFSQCYKNKDKRKRHNQVCHDTSWAWKQIPVLPSEPVLPGWLPQVWLPSRGRCSLVLDHSFCLLMLKKLAPEHFNLAWALKLKGSQRKAASWQESSGKATVKGAASEAVEIPAYWRS